MGREKIIRNKKEIDLIKLVAVFSLSTLIFMIGVLVGNYISSKKLDNINILEQDLRTETMAIETQFMLLSEEPCSAIDSTTLTEELYKISERLDYMESKLGEDDPDVLRLKEYYSILQLRHWLLIKRINRECRTEFNLINYFYSNKGDCPKCEQQGFILTYIRKRYDNVRVYAYDINIDNVALNTFKEIYNVTTAPTVIISDKVYERFVTKAEIEEEIE
ncbi:hypothetical protein JW930_06355 [Candidatus Woesearchaeota archaeon]|nr:hypothetical protein [Candidatus Woesearchaeota archaeon]